MQWHTLFDSVGSLYGGLNASAPCDSDVLNAPLMGNAKKEFIMMPPEEKLAYFDRRARAHEDNQEVGGHVAMV